MGNPGEMAAAFEAVLKTGDFAKLGALVQEYATDDFVEEWPHSGERLNRDALKKMGNAAPRSSKVSA